LTAVPGVFPGVAGGGASGVVPFGVWGGGGVFACGGGSVTFGSVFPAFATVGTDGVPEAFERDPGWGSRPVLRTTPTPSAAATRTRTTGTGTPARRGVSGAGVLEGLVGFFTREA
jgi:hypothetical protein